MKHGAIESRPEGSEVHRLAGARGPVSLVCILAGPHVVLVHAFTAEQSSQDFVTQMAAGRELLRQAGVEIRAQCVHSSPGLELVLAGSPGKQAPREMPGARPLGQVTIDELADLYSVAGCLVFTSRYEGFGLTPLEAMSCGCPVAAFRNSSIPEVVADAGALVNDGDAPALGRAAAAQIADGGPARSAGLKRARAFSWSKTARLTIAAYEALLR